MSFAGAKRAGVSSGGGHDRKARPAGSSDNPDRVGRRPPPGSDGEHHVRCRTTFAFRKRRAPPEESKLPARSPRRAKLTRGSVAEGPNFAHQRPYALSSTTFRAGTHTGLLDSRHAFHDCADCNRAARDGCHVSASTPERQIAAGRDRLRHEARGSLARSASRCPLGAEASVPRVANHHPVGSGARLFSSFLPQVAGLVKGQVRATRGDDVDGAITVALSLERASAPPLFESTDALKNLDRLVDQLAIAMTLALGQDVAPRSVRCSRCSRSPRQHIATSGLPPCAYSTVTSPKRESCTHAHAPFPEAMPPRSRRRATAGRGRAFLVPKAPRPSTQRDRSRLSQCGRLSASMSPSARATLAPRPQPSKSYSSTPTTAHNAGPRPFRYGSEAAFVL